MCLLHEQSERCLLYLPWTLSILVRQNSPEPQQAIVYASLRSMREKEGKFGHDHQYTIVYHSGSDRVRGICMIYAYICPICKADKDAGFAGLNLKSLGRNVHWKDFAVALLRSRCVYNRLPVCTLLKLDPSTSLFRVLD